MSSLFTRPVVVKKMAEEGLKGREVFMIETNPLFTRLHSGLHQGEENSQIEVSVKFTTSVLGLPQLDLELQGYLQVQCQRCMDAFALPLQQMTTYLLFDDVKALEALEKQNGELLGDKFESLLLPAPDSSDKARQGELDLAALVEDELLLSIPLYPRHENIKDCSTAALDVELLEEAVEEQEPEQAEKQSPFAGLDKLLKH